MTASVYPQMTQLLRLAVSGQPTQVVGDVKHAAVIDPTVVFGSPSHLGKTEQAESQDQGEVVFHDDAKSSMFLAFRRNKV